jgi:hypothetical protein
MERRTQLILNRARELFSRSHPGETWPKAVDRPDAKVMARQAEYLARAEDQLLKEGKIESVDQS